MAGGLLRGVSVHACGYGGDDVGVSDGCGGDAAGLYGEAVDRGGGIKERAEVDELDAMGVDAVAGMAVYSGAMEA